MCDNMPAHPDVLLSPPQWSRAREQLSMKEVVRRSSTGGGVTPVERSWPRAQWPTGASWCRAGGQELAPTPTGTGLRLQLVSQGTQLAGTPKTERLIFLWTIYNLIFFFYYFSISCQYWITVHYPRVIIFYHWIRPLKASSDCALLYTDIHGPPPLPRNVIVTA